MAVADPPAASGSLRASARSRETAETASTGSARLQQVEALVPGLDRGEDERGRPDLEEGRHLHAVGVAQDDVEAPPPVGVRVGLVSAC